MSLTFEQRAELRARVDEARRGQMSAAQKLRDRRRRRNQVSRTAAARRLAEGRVRHGTTSGYQDGCRCEECRAAKAAYARWKRAADLRAAGLGDRCPGCGRLLAA